MKQLSCSAVRHPVALDLSAATPFSVAEPATPKAPHFEHSRKAHKAPRGAQALLDSAGPPSNKSSVFAVKKPSPPMRFDDRAAIRRKFLASFVAGGGALVLSACGGGSGPDASDLAAVDNRARSRRASGASAASSASNAAAANAGAATGVSTVGEAVAQMKLPHEAKPKGVPSDYDWAQAPVVWQSKPPANFTAMTSWGEIQFAAGSGATAAADTALLRNMRTYLLNSAGQLTLAQDAGSINGAQMLPSFADNTSFPTQMSNANGVTEVLLNPSQAFQFFPPDRASAPAGTQAVIVSVEAMIVAPAGAKDPNINSSYILALGADWWQSMTAEWSNFTTNYGVGTGRFCFLTTSWQTFTFTSIQNPSASLAATSFAS